jgi:phage terminase large subunit
LINKKYQELFRHDSRYYIVTGGRGSSKSFSVTVYLVDLLLRHKGHKVLFTRYTLTAANKSIIPEFIEKIELLNALPFFTITQNEIKCTLTGSSIIFAGIKTSSGNQTANLKSLQGVSIWVLEEAEELIDESIFDKINLSVRQKGVQNKVILILNPTTKEHFIYKRFFEDMNVQAGYNGTKDNTTYIHTTYLDNVANLDESFLKDVERIKKTRPQKYKHQILGGWLDRAEGVVFDNWSIDETFPQHLPVSYGQDFGFSNDPTVLVKVAIEKDTIYVQSIYGKTGLSTKDIYELNKAETKDKYLIIADSAEPRLIHELRRMGNNIKECIKGKDSIVTGIKNMQDYHIKVINSPEIIKELNNYAWHDKKSNVPIDAYNHYIDAIRYCVGDLLRKQRGGSHFIGK